MFGIDAAAQRHQAPLRIGARVLRTCGRASGRVLRGAVVAAGLCCFALCAAVPVDIATEAWLAVTAGALILLLARRERTGFRRVLLLLLCLVLTLRYFTWRVSETLVYYDPVSLLGTVLLFVAELYSLALTMLGLFVNVLPITRPAGTAPVDALAPAVDVLIPSYNEDPELLAVTVCAATQIAFPAGRLRVHLLDDGGTDGRCADPDPARAAAAQARRRDLQALCLRFGATYRTRPRNEHAKAGNINHALPHLDGDLVLILDADHVPTADILARTVPMFRDDPRLFLVQTPHFFMNPDTVEKNLDLFMRMPGENEMFHRGVQSGLDFWNSSFFCGSAAVIHRGRLLEVGGIATSTITEDAETALALHGRGYTSAYVAHPMVAGLAPETFTGLVVQRVRWGQGMLQILLLKNPLAARGLSLSQRLGYLSTTLYWFFPFARVVFLFAPVAYLVFGLKVYAANVSGVLVFGVPHMLASVISSAVMFNRFRWPLISHVYETLLGTLMLRPLLATLRNPRAPDFKVTPKGETLDADFVSPLVRPFYAIFAVTALALPMAAWRLWADPEHRGLVAITAAWEVFNLLVLLGALGALFERKQRRVVPRLAADLPAALLMPGGARTLGRIDNLSTGGAQFVAEGVPGPELDGATEVEVQAPHLADPVRLAIHVRSRRGRACGLAFAAAEDQFRPIVSLVHGDSGRWAAVWADPARGSGGLHAFRVMAQTGLSALLSHASHVLPAGIRLGRSALLRRRGPASTHPSKGDLHGKTA